MKTANILKAVCTVGLTATCAWGLIGCVQEPSPSLTGGVAATVNGAEIAEDDVTKAIETVRANYAIETEEAWGEYLAENDMTPEQVREEMIDSYIQQELMKQGAAEKGITVESSEVDGYVEQMKVHYDTDEKWKTALNQAGFDSEEKYRETLESNLLSEKLMESFASEEEPSDEELLEVASTYASSYTGAKRSSHILFDSGDEVTAQSVLDQINGGTLDFAEAAAQYSKDSSGSNGGDVGWDKLTTFVDEYQDALDGLEKDQVSGLVTSDYGIHIIKCTDVFTAPEEATSLDQFPSEFVDSFKTVASQQKKSEAYQAWYDEYKAAADIKVNPMPEGLSYAIDMSKYQTDEGDDAADGEGAADGAEQADEGAEEAESSGGDADAADEGDEAPADEQDQAA